MRFKIKFSNHLRENFRNSTEMMEVALHDSNENDDFDSVCLGKRRHLETIEWTNHATQTWRMKERMKTVSVALVLCLNVGVDPPDFVKIDPCARLECWIDPLILSPQKALELIGSSLQKQYERWQPRARYKQSLDPTVEDVKKLCTSLRRNAKEERVLFHYNGHGVPRPTQNGEIWVFNRTYTQYIPLSIYDLQTWMGAPSIYVYDCSNAGMIVNSFINFAEQHEAESLNNTNNRSTPPNQMTGSQTSHVSYKNCIQLAACAANQILPMNHNLPADLFTSCLTTPIKTALKWFTLQPQCRLVPHVNYEMIEKIPGTLNDRRTMLGELNWIFTAITDTIAWNTLPRELFQKLFRQDLLVASLFRNFLLADRILRSYDCTPVSHPTLPQTFRHPMWAAWDLALDVALSQLPDILANKKQFEYSPFFEEQLTAFQVYLEGNPDQKSPPEQLPIVLQVLLSQVHRLRALELLGRFLDIGPWAVNLALSVGIFPYVLKLLQSPAVELRPCLVFIWAKILAVDGTCQIDIVKESVDSYFLAALSDRTPIFYHDCRTFAAFVLASIVYRFEQGQVNALKSKDPFNALSICLEQINDDNPLLRKWFAICLGNLWHNFEAARHSGARDLAQEKLQEKLLRDPVPEVRAAAVYALGTFISSAATDRQSQDNDMDRSIAINLLHICGNDVSPLVRMELVAALQWIVKLFDAQFVEVCLREDPQFQSNSHTLVNNSNNASLTRAQSARFPQILKSVSSCGSIATMTHPNALGFTQTSYSSIYSKIWQGIVALSRDPHPEVAQMGLKVAEYIRNQAIELIKAKEAISNDQKSNSGSSFSSPPSPNTKTNYLESESPSRGSPNTNQYMTNVNVRDLLNTSNNNSMRMSSTESVSSGMSQKAVHKLRVPLVKTNFIEWEIGSFARPSKFLLSDIAPISDQHSMDTLRHKERIQRNREVRMEGEQQQRRVLFNKLETQCFIGKTSYTPHIVKLHPYEQQIIVAYKDRVMLNDWNTSVVTSLIPPIQSPTTIVTTVTGNGLNSTIQTTSNSKRVLAATTSCRVSTVELLNPQDRGLVLVGYDDGSIRIWKNGFNSNIVNHASQNPPRNSNLLTAFQALEIYSNKSAKKYGLITGWHQKSLTLVVGGESKFIRLWDLEKELKVAEIPTGSNFVVSHISVAPTSGVFAVGLGDGVIKMYDKRINHRDSLILSYREHCHPLLTLCMRNDNESMVSGCSNGEVRLFDIRRRSSVQNWSAGSDITCMSVHTKADVIACAGQYISIHSLDGQLLNTIRCHEGFMGPKLGQTSCLSFHPHKVSIAAGFVDNTVSVYMTGSNE